MSHTLQVGPIRIATRDIQRKSMQYARGHAMDAKREKARKFLAGAKKMQQKTNARKPAPDVKQGWASRAEKHATRA